MTLGVDAMYVIKVGINHKITPIDIRESLTFSENEAEAAMVKLNQQESILENVILSTCNRMEIYAVVDHLHKGNDAITNFLANWFQIKKSTFTPYLEVLKNDKAVKHLFYVITGLHSMVLGETQILGQVRNAFLTAQKHHTTKNIFNELFKRAITFAKRVHKHTKVSAKPVSISYVAIELLKDTLESINDKNIVVIGAGEMSELALKHLCSSGARNITIVNRTFQKAQKLADIFKGHPAPIENMLKVMQDADIVITSTGATSPILSKQQMLDVQKNRQQRLLCLLDIALPRDIDADVKAIENIQLYDIDDLQFVVDKNLETRKKAAEEIKGLIQEEVRAFKEWITILSAVPVLAALQEKAFAIQEKTYASILRKIPRLTEREKEVLSKHMASIVNQLLKTPIKQAKKSALTSSAEDSLAFFVDVFGLDETVKNDISKHIDRYHTLSHSSSDELG